MNEIIFFYFQKMDKFLHARNGIDVSTSDPHIHFQSTGRHSNSNPREILPTSGKIKYKLMQKTVHSGAGQFEINHGRTDTAKIPRGLFNTTYLKRMRFYQRYCTLVNVPTNRKVKTNNRSTFLLQPPLHSNPKIILLAIEMLITE